MTIFTFTIGSYGYSLGRSLHYGNQYIAPKILNLVGILKNNKTKNSQ